MHNNNRLLMVIMDGIGLNPNPFGNAVYWAKTPTLDSLQKESLFLPLAAHGTHVGLPNKDDLGNSEVGHNVIGSGQVFDQGAKLVQNAIDSRELFRGESWTSMIKQTLNSKSSLHFIGLISNGNIHSPYSHLLSMCTEAAIANIPNIYIHILTDGRDVDEGSAETFVETIEQHLKELMTSHPSLNARIASGGGRMHITMDRYDADWSMVERGWNTHVHGRADFEFRSTREAFQELRNKGHTSDQHLPSFAICDKNNVPVGKIKNDDSVVFFNFRGDRAIEISKAFEESNFTKFDRGPDLKVNYFGMMQYDGDLKIPHNFLVSPPSISNTLGEYISNLKLSQFACSETQKYGHVTFFWNGNRSGKFNDDLETYLEIPSDLGHFDSHPEMKAEAITQATVKEIENPNGFRMGRINFANGDMVGHTGNFYASVKAVEAVDRNLGILRAACKKNGVDLIVTADHGNCDEMFNEKPDSHPNWNPETSSNSFKRKTSHTLAPVPCYIESDKKFTLNSEGFKDQSPTIANLASTSLILLGQHAPAEFSPSLITPK